MAPQAQTSLPPPPTSAAPPPDAAATPEEREDVNLTIGGKSFNINAPKGLSNDEIVRRAINADDEFAGLARTNEKTAGIYAQEQARKKTSQLPGTLPAPQGGDSFTYPSMGGVPVPNQSGMTVHGTPEEIAQTNKDYAGDAKTALAVSGSLAAAPAAAGMGVLGTAATEGAGAAVGAGAGSAMEGNSPGKIAADAAIAGGTTAAGSALIGGTMAAGRKLIGPWLARAAAPATEAELSGPIAARAGRLHDLQQAEEGMRQSIAGAPRSIRQNILNNVYPKIDGPVDLYGAARTAVSATNDNIASGVPASIAKTRQISLNIRKIEGVLSDQLSDQLGDMSMLAKAGIKPEVVDEEGASAISKTLDDLKNMRQISFRQAQNLNSAIGKAMAKGKGYNLPDETFQALKSVKDEVTQAMERTAGAEGKLNQWRMGQRVFKQFMDDFYNPGAPLKGALNAKPGQTGSVIKSLTNDANGGGIRAEAAMRRWGLNTEAKGLRGVMDTGREQIGNDINDMRQLTASPKAYNEGEMAAAKEADAARVAESQKQLQQARDKSKKIAKRVVLGGAVGHYLTE